MNQENDGVQFVPSFPADIRQQIVDALLKIAQTEEGQEALSIAYDWSEVEVQDDSFYDEFRQWLDAQGITLDD